MKRTWAADLATAVETAFVESNETIEFSTSRYFNEWYKRRGNSYIFVFTKNLRVTNLQFSELLALIADHIHPRERIHFEPRSVLDETLDDAVASFQGAGVNDPGRIASQVVALYGDQIAHTCVIEPYFGSCAVFLPPMVELDINTVCGLSGYVHSAGRNVYVRRVVKALEDEFVGAVASYIERFRSGQAPSLFVPYSHEDFTPYDGALRSELRNGLDDLKVYVEKYHMGATPLVEVLARLPDATDHRVIVAPPGKYSVALEQLREGGKTDPTHTLWLVVDRGIDVARTTASDERYYVCYDQLIRNANPFQIFDENKPGWLDHTTLPHSACAALVNATQRASETNRGRVTFCDMFAGSGTLGLELVKYPAADVRQSDREPSANSVALDNLWVFSLGDDQLRSLQDTLARAWNGELFEHPPSLFADTGAADPAACLGRFVAYLDRRVERRRGTALARLGQASTSAHSAAKAARDEEAKRLLGQLESLIELRRYEAATGKPVAGSASLTLFSERPTRAYSPKVTVRRGRLEEALRQHKATGDPVIEERDASSLKIEDGLVHVVITDPPYGFNTDEGLALAATYRDAFRRALHLIVDGDLVVCLLERAHVGKNAFPFTHPRFVARQIVALATALGKRVELRTSLDGMTEWPFVGPYYWESERALRREILHFRVRP